MDTNMADDEKRQSLEPPRLTYCSPSENHMASGRGKLAKDALSFVRIVPKTISDNVMGVSFCQQKVKVECPCERKTKNILCQTCGHVFAGRVRMNCRVHPNTIHLMDIACCPVCQASHLKEFSDFSSKRE